MHLAHISLLPTELLTAIFIEVNDWKLSAVLESIFAGLPNVYSDAGIAIDSIDFASIFPATSALIKAEISVNVKNTFLEAAIAFKMFGPRIETALINGNLDSLKITRYLVETHGVDPDRNVAYGAYPGMVMAAVHGSLDVVKFLHANGNLCSTFAMDKAAENGDLEMVRFLHEARTEGCTTNAMDMACSNGHMEVVLFLHQYRKEGCSKKAMDGAIANGHLEILKLLHTMNPKKKGCSDYAMDEAANLEVLKYLHETVNANCSPACMDNAAAKGRLDMFEYLHTNRSEGCSLEALRAAAAGGHLDVVKFIRQNGLIGNWSKVPAEAVKSGHLNILRYCRELGIDSTDFYPHDLARAASEGHLDVIRELLDTGSTLCIRHLMQFACAGGRIDLIAFLYERYGFGCPFHDDPAYEAVKSRMAFTKSGCKDGGLLMAASKGHLEAVRFLVDRGSEECTREALATAKGEDVIGYLRKNTSQIASATVTSSTPSNHPVLFGVYDYEGPDFNQSLGNLQSLQTFQSKPFGVVHFFTQWCQAVAQKPWYDTIVFQEKLPSIWNDMRAIPLISWQPACFDPDSKTPDTFLKDVVAGKYVDFVDSWAMKLLAFVKGPDGISGTADDRRVYLRLAHEMNTVFYQWAPAKNPSITPQDYINFWRYTRSRFDSLGFLKSQIQWVWCPNNFDSGNIKAESLYPGNDAVDWVGFDGYNGAGIFNDGAGWASPKDLMTSIISRLNAITSGQKPIGAMEIGTVREPNPSFTLQNSLAAKATWLRDFYTLAAKGPSDNGWTLSMVVYFNQDKWAVLNHGETPLEPGWKDLVNDPVVGLVSGDRARPGYVSNEVFWGVKSKDGSQANGGDGPVAYTAPKPSGASIVAAGCGRILGIFGMLLVVFFWR
ncbi:hypothetical protein HDU97_002337 [Phlyctochytrium planicorne]|nr:hypothetical protein HDU97_002337 [Phlyctochytrium planicorne]